MPVLDTERLMEDRVSAIRAYHAATGIARAELDVSGGLDSATVLLLLARALGPDNITAVYTSIHSSDESRDRAVEAAHAAGVALAVVDLTPSFDAAVAALRDGLAAAGFDMDAIDARCEGDPSVIGSIRSCFRAPLGRGANRLTGGGIRHGTGNECEDLWLRFYQKGGDGEVDTNPIVMLSKGEVFQIGRALGVPRSILTAVPSPDLHGTGEAHNDEDELYTLTGVHWTYSRVDADTGHYTTAGTIERLSRFIDDLESHVDLFGADEPGIAALRDRALLTTFSGLDSDDVAAYLASARKLEAATRHKWNPNIPALGEREDLVEAGILSNDIAGAVPADA